MGRGEGRTEELGGGDAESGVHGHDGGLKVEICGENQLIVSLGRDRSGIGYVKMYGVEAPLLRV